MLKTCRLLAISPLMLLLGSQALHADYADVVERTFLFENGNELDLKADTGNVKIRGGASDKCVIHIYRKVPKLSEKEALKALNDLEIDLDQKSSGKVEIKLEKDQSWLEQIFGDDNSIEIIIEVELPSQAELDVNTQGGNIQVDDIYGKMKLSTSGGDIYLSDGSGEASLTSSGGDLTIKQFKGDLRLKTSGGDVNSDDTDGDMDARSTGGDIDISNHSGEILAASTGGDIDISLKNMLTAKMDLKSTGGDIHLKLIKGSEFTFNAEALGGDIAVQFSDLNTLKQSFKDWDAEVNGGGPKVNLKSLGGDIAIGEIEPKVH